MPRERIDGVELYWELSLEGTRKLIVANAPTFVDDVNDPEPFFVDLSRLAAFSQPILLTQGEYRPSPLKFIRASLRRNFRRPKL